MQPVDVVVPRDVFPDPHGFFRPFPCAVGRTEARGILGIIAGPWEASQVPSVDANPFLLESERAFILPLSLGVFRAPVVAVGQILMLVVTSAPRRSAAVSGCPPGEFQDGNRLQWPGEVSERLLLGGGSSNISSM